MSDERDYYLQVSESIKSLFDLTTRIDERVKHMQITQQEMQTKMDSQLKADYDMDGRLQVIESKVHSLNGSSSDEIKDRIRCMETEMALLKQVVSKSESRWEKIVKVIVQLGWIVVAAYVLTQLGLQAPQVP